MKAVKTTRIHENARHTSSLISTALMVVVWFCLFCVSSPQLFASPQLISARDVSQASDAGGNGDSGSPIISPDGRFVLFASSANNLTKTTGIGFVPTQTMMRLNVFLRDRTSGTSKLASINLAGNAGGNGDSLPEGISDDGRYVLFESSASDLVAGDTNGTSDVFVRDMVLGTTVLVSASISGGSGNGASGNAAITPDGRYVCFTSSATNLVGGDANGIADVFVRDLKLVHTTLISVGAQNPFPGTPGISSMQPEITPDGNYVAFYSTATNLVAGITNSGELYIRALSTATTYWGSTNARALASSLLGQNGAISYNHQLSTNGNYLAYEASASTGTNGLILRYNLQTGSTDVIHTNAAIPLPGQESSAHNLDMSPDGRFVAFVGATNNSATCVLRWDGQTGNEILVSSNLSGGITSNALSDWPAMDASGRFVAFISNDTNLTANSSPFGYDLYVRDLNTGNIIELDLPQTGPAANVNPLFAPVISADGSLVAFEEQLDGNLIANDKNHASDVFARVLSTSTNELVSARDPTLSTQTPSGSSQISVTCASSNGLYVAFASDADNLVSNDTNGWRDVFVRDVANGTNILVSVAADGVSKGNGISTSPSISGDGRFVAFASAATNLVSGDTNSWSDVFVRDLVTGTTELVSAGMASGSFGNGASYSPTISKDGRFVLFHSQATNLGVGPFQGFGTENLLLRDRMLQTNYGLTYYGVLFASMTPDGRYIAFRGERSPATSYLIYVWDSQSSNIIYTNSRDTTYSSYSVTISPNGQWLAYLYGVSFSSGMQLRLVNLASNAFQTVITGGFPSRPGLSFSSDGRFLTYSTTTGVVAADTNGLADVYLYDTVLGTNQLVSRGGFSGGAANGAADMPQISPDGRFVVYRSFATNVVFGDTNGVADFFLFDRVAGSTTLLTSSVLGASTSNERGITAQFSDDSKTLFFQSWASDLVPMDLNRSGDIFSSSLYPPVDSTGSNLLSGFSTKIFALPGGAGINQGQFINWPAVPGKSYQLQFKNDLNDATWQTINGGVVLVGTNGYGVDPAPSGSKRFYRVVLGN